MYYKDYNPTIHDIYLYGPSNTGIPIGLNPNSLIYGASADFRCVIPRNRQFTGTGPVPVPPGTSAAYLPNYYNIKDSPLFLVMGTETVSSMIHYSANLPSDSITIAGLAKWTGTTTAYPINNLYLWNANYTGLCSYGPWTGLYNCVPLNQITGATSYALVQYFNGSPEISGFSAGSTYYQIFSPDLGLMDLLSGPTLSQSIAKKISFSALAQDVYLQGNTVEYQNNLGDQTTVKIKIESPDLYFWDGSDKIIPVPLVYADYIHDANGKSIGPLLVSISFPGTANYQTGDTYAGWAGDSSSLLVYKKNNSLYFVGSVTSIGTNSLVPGYFSFIGPLYITDTLPLYNFLGFRELDRNHYWYPLTDGVTLATQIDFTRIENSLNTLIPQLNNLYQQFAT